MILTMKSARERIMTPKQMNHDNDRISRFWCPFASFYFHGTARHYNATPDKYLS